MSEDNTTKTPYKQIIVPLKWIAITAAVIAAAYLAWQGFARWWVFALIAVLFV